MAQQIILPRLSDMEDEGTVSEWLVAVGDDVEIGTPIVAIEMSKAMVEVEATHAGKVARLVAQPGETIKIGQPLLELE